jgi:hypothetical protein
MHILRRRSAQQDLERERQRLQIADQALHLVRPVEIADAEPHRFGPEPPHPVEDQARGTIQQQRHLPVGLPERLGGQHEAQVVRLPRQAWRRPPASGPGPADDRHMALRMFMVEAEDQGDGDGDLEERGLVAATSRPAAAPPRSAGRRRPRIARAPLRRGLQDHAPRRPCCPKIRRLQKLSTSVRHLVARPDARPCRSSA